MVICECTYQHSGSILYSTYANLHNEGVYGYLRPKAALFGVIHFGAGPVQVEGGPFGFFSLAEGQVEKAKKVVGVLRYRMRNQGSFLRSELNFSECDRGTSELSP